MKTTTLFSAALFAASACSASATLAMWQAEVGAGTAPVATQFTAVSAPTVVDVGALSGDRTFEFIFNANSAAAGSPSSALIGSQAADGSQGIKYEQWQDTGFFGATAFGVADFTSTVPVQDNVDLHAVFTSNGATTDFYLNGSLAYTYTGFSLALTGMQGLGAARNSAGTGFIDPLPGTIHGFASYDSTLAAAEVLSHYNAFAAIPEPTGALLVLLAGGAFGMVRRRSSVAARG